MSKKVIVLGATGAMGRYLVPLLAERGFLVDAVTIDEPPANSPNVNYIKLSGTKGTFELMPIERFDKKPLTARVFFTEDNDYYTAGEHIIDFGIITDRYALHLGEFASMVRGELPDPYTRAHDYLVHKITLAASGVLPFKK